MMPRRAPQPQEPGLEYMTLRVVGAGLPRTGTASLKAALEHLLGRPCYHMMELIQNLEHVPIWHAAVRGDMPDWPKFLSNYGATVDWPAAAFWRELSEAFPQAIVLFSVRDADSWWESVSRTVFSNFTPLTPEWKAMMDDMGAARFTTQTDVREAAVEAFHRHNTAVRDAIPPDRLVEWRGGDGWGPICNALGLAVPDEPFPHTNTREEFIERIRAREAERGGA